MSRLMRVGRERLNSLIRNLSEVVSDVMDMALKLFDRGLGNEELSKLAVDIDSLTGVSEMLKDQLLREATIYIARFQPVGEELTYIENLISASYDLFRAARYCRELALLSEVSGHLLGELDARVRELMDLASRMVRDSIRAFLEGDAVLASKVLELDDEVDREYLKTLEEVSRSEGVRKELAIKLLALRHVERIADHATYIAVRVTYVWRG